MKDGSRRYRAAGALQCLLAAVLALCAGEALAHAADRGFVLLLPTGYYLWGGAAAVALSFVMLAMVPPGPLDRALRRSRRLIGVLFDGRIVTSLASFLVLGVLAAAGFWGSRDPLSNPLPLVVWTLWWVGITLLSGLFGNLWRWLEPWYGPYRLICALLRLDPENPPLKLPARLGYLPAIALFLGFAWFELVHPAPDDPARLATAVCAYWAFTFLAILLFGHREWTARAECFSIFFSMVARLSLFERTDPARPGSALFLRLPGGKLSDADALPLTGALFLLLALSTVSFDGLKLTFFWLGFTGINPLEFPGRSAVTGWNSLGLVAMFVLLAFAFLVAVWLGGLIARSKPRLGQAAGLLVWSIIPISLAYHFSHYLVSLAIDGQYALVAISDPFSIGWNLFGTAGYHVRAGATMGHDSAWIIWNLQAGAIIGGHMLAIAIAHAIAYRLHGDARRAALSQLPLALLMVGYTVFGLWLLSSPTA